MANKSELISSRIPVFPIPYKSISYHLLDLGGLLRYIRVFSTLHDFPQLPIARYAVDIFNSYSSRTLTKRFFYSSLWNPSSSGKRSSRSVCRSPRPEDRDSPSISSESFPSERYPGCAHPLYFCHLGSLPNFLSLAFCKIQVGQPYLAAQTIPFSPRGAEHQRPKLCRKVSICLRATA